MDTQILHHHQLSGTLTSVGTKERDRSIGQKAPRHATAALPQHSSENGPLIGSTTIEGSKRRCDGMAGERGPKHNSRESYPTFFLNQPCSFGFVTNRWCFLCANFNMGSPPPGARPMQETLAIYTQMPYKSQIVSTMSMVEKCYRSASLQ